MIISIKIHVEKNDNCQGVQGDCLINNNQHTPPPLPPFENRLNNHLKPTFIFWVGKKYFSSSFHTW
jgi:hypothetical protein